MTKGDELSQKELRALLDLAGELPAQVDQQKVVLALLQQACDFTGSPEGSVLLFDPAREGLFFVAARGPKDKEVLQKFGERSAQRVPMRSNAGQAFRSGEITITSDAQTDAEHSKVVDDQVKSETKSVISVPLKVGGAPVGVLQLLNKVDEKGEPCAYDAHDVALLEDLGRIAAAAINNVRIVRKLNAQTGLYGREGLSQYLEALDEKASPARLTFLFADMRGFTQLCRFQDAERTQEILNDFLGMLADRVLIRGGIVNKFIGDAVFAFFRGKEAPAAAVRCAFDMLDSFDKLKQVWQRSSNESLRFLDIGIGIATGTAALGSFGSEEVKNFTAIGTMVNLAAAFENAARDGRRLLVDNVTFAAAQDIVKESEGPMEFLLGKPGQVKIPFDHYHLKSLTGPIRVFLSHNNKDRNLVDEQIRVPLASLGVQTWYAEQDIIPGDDYIHSIQDALLRCDWMLVVLTENAASDWVRAEVNTALKDPRFKNRVVPVQLDQSLPSQVSMSLGDIDALDVRTAPNVADAIYQFLLDRESKLRKVVSGGEAV